MRLRPFCLPLQLLAVVLIFTLSGQPWFAVRGQISFTVTGAEIITLAIPLVLLSITLLMLFTRGRIIRVSAAALTLILPFWYLLSPLTVSVFYGKISAASGIAGRESLRKLLAGSSIDPQGYLWFALLCYLIYLLALAGFLFLPQPAKAQQQQSLDLWEEVERGADSDLTEAEDRDDPDAKPRLG